MRQKALRASLRLIGPMLLVFVLIRMKNAGAILDTLRNADPWPLVIAFALNFANLQCKVSRWNVILSAIDVQYSMRRAWEAYLASAYIGMLTPGRVGDVLRVQYLRHDLNVEYSKGLATIVMDRLCDLYVLGIFSAIGIMRFGSVLVGQLAYLSWAMVLASVLGPLIFLVPSLSEGVLLRAFNKFSRSTDSSGFSTFLATLRAQVRPSLVKSILLTVVAFLINYLQGYLLARAIHVNITIFDSMCLVSIASLLGLLPISISGVGVRELFFSLTLPVLGYAADQGVTLGLLVFVFIYVAVIGAGLIAWQIAPPPTGAADAT